MDPRVPSAATKKRTPNLQGQRNLQDQTEASVVRWACVSVKGKSRVLKLPKHNHYLRGTEEESNAMEEIRGTEE